MRTGQSSAGFGMLNWVRPASQRQGETRSLERGARFANLMSETGGSRGIGAASPRRPETATAAPVAAVDPPPVSPARSEAETSFAASAGALATLRTALAELGIDTGSATFTPRAELVSTPFGSYWNRQIEVRTPDGRWGMYSADLVQKSPQVAACEVSSLLTRSG